MSKHNAIKPIKSKWDARFLVNTIMGVLETQKTLSSEIVMGVVTAAVRSYSRGHFGGMNLSREIGVYWALKNYALDKAKKNAKDAELMKAFLKLVSFAENDLRREEAENHEQGELSPGFIINSLDNDELEIVSEKSVAGVPLNCFTEEEVTLVSEQSQEYFNAKFFASDCEPRKGMLVFDDDEGLRAFAQWMETNHPELIHEEKDNDQ